MLAVTLSTVILLCLTAVHANTEKVIFLGPESIQTFTAHPKLQDLNIETISPLSSASSSLRLHLPVAFPFETAPRGIDSWYLLDNLKPWSRYEVRVCWAAIQPTDFWLTTHTISEVFDTPHLITSLATFSGARQGQPAAKAKPQSDRAAAPEESSVLFLQVSAAADFFTSNKTLMNQPPPVLVDLILDPYVFNIFPQSLLPTALYITIIAIISWYLSDYIYAWLYKVAEHEKPHIE